MTTEIIDYQEHGVSAPIEPHRTSEIQKHFAVQCQVGETKTEGSACPLPINPDLTTRLRESHKGSAYRAPGDRVFANDAGQPRRQETILQRQLKPAALRAGIGKIGRHTFRHTYSTMLPQRRHRHQGAAGAAATCQHPDHDERLHTGGLGSEACREQRRRGNGAVRSENCA